jgi:tetratricopeptide (TPR) repeat protein
MTSLRPTPIPISTESQKLPIWDGAPTGPAFNPVQMGNVPQEPPARTKVSPGSVFEPVYQPAANASQKSLQAQPARPDPLLDSELETTMKRPAVRLQALAQRPVSTQDQSVSLKRGRAGERERPGTGKVAESNLSAQERLVRGYQCQLAGDYDGAMQEYRVIVKSAPELLGEVVSNVRALLKLAPKYSVGYRVLGDAYMRQGEYLQAMEAYNKALTMAKKARN